MNDIIKNRYSKTTSYEFPVTYPTQWIKHTDLCHCESSDLGKGNSL